MEESELKRAQERIAELERQLSQKSQTITKLAENIKAREFSFANQLKNIEAQKKDDPPPRVNFLIGEATSGPVKRPREESTVQPEQKATESKTLSKFYVPPQDPKPRVFVNPFVVPEAEKISLSEILKGENIFGLTEEEVQRIRERQARTLRFFNEKGDLPVRSNAFSEKAKPQELTWNPRDQNGEPEAAGKFGSSNSEEEMFETRCKSAVQSAIDAIGSDPFCSGVYLKGIQAAKNILDAVLSDPQMSTNERIQELRYDVLEKAEEDVIESMQEKTGDDSDLMLETI